MIVTDDRDRFLEMLREMVSPPDGWIDQANAKITEKVGEYTDADMDRMEREAQEYDRTGIMPSTAQQATLMEADVLADTLVDLAEKVRDREAQPGVQLLETAHQIMVGCAPHAGDGVKLLLTAVAQLALRAAAQRQDVVDQVALALADEADRIDAGVPGNGDRYLDGVASGMMPLPLLN